MGSAGTTASRAVRTAVRGELGGSGFLEAVVARADQIGARGWVRESGEGEATAHVEGSEAEVEAMLAFLRDGPAGARVDAAAVERIEPEGHEQFAVRGVAAGRFEVVARERGFELRLEVGGAVRAWSLPKGPSMDPAVKRMAFEAAAAAAPDAGGSRWDEGAYEQGGRVPWPEALERGHAVFVLHGGRLTGGFALQRIRSEPRPQWLLIKRSDDDARRGSDVVAESARSGTGDGGAAR